jgi:hypothetical protein
MLSASWRHLALSLRLAGSGLANVGTTTLIRCTLSDNSSYNGGVEN